MYMMKLDPEQVAEMYHIREALKERGIRYPITQQVRDAVSDFIIKYNSDNNSNGENSNVKSIK